MKEKIGFVGLGIMGKPMASNLLDAEYSVNAYDLISKKGYSDTMGARPIGRIITNEIKKPLADEIIHGRLKNGGFVTVQTSGDKFEIKVNSKIRLKAN